MKFSGHISECDSDSTSSCSFLLSLFGFTKMSSTPIQEAISCFAPKLRQWYRNREGDPNIRDDDIDLNTVTALYGKDKLLKEYKEIQNASEALLDYDEGVSDVNFDTLFTLNKIEEKHSVKFTHTRTVYDVQISPLMKH